MAPRARPARHRTAALPILALAALSLLAPAPPALADVTYEDPPPAIFSGSALFNATSGDGSRVVFTSRRPLARDDRDGLLDVYLRTEGRTTLLSPSSGGGGANADVRFVAATPDARTVLFRTEERLTGDDEDLTQDMYRRGPSGLELISISQSGEAAKGKVRFGSFGTMSVDGRRVFFTTNERLLAEDGDDSFDVYEHRGGRLSLVAPGIASNVTLLEVAADGSRVLVHTTVGLDPRDGDRIRDIYSYADGQPTLISGSGSDVCPAYPRERGGCNVYYLDASSDARRVFFDTLERLSPRDSDSSSDVFRGDGRTVELISTGPGDPNSPRPLVFRGLLAAISPDGRRALFVTVEKFPPLAGNTRCALYERRGGRTRLVSIVRGRPLSIDSCEFDDIAVSDDGSTVVFSSGWSEERPDVAGELYRRRHGRTALVSALPPPSPRKRGAFLHHLSADGSRVTFLTGRSLVPADSDGGYDIYTKGPRGFSLISIGPAGGNAPHRTAPGSFFDADVFTQFGGASQDGRRIFFATREQLLRRDRNGKIDLYERGPSGLSLVSVR